MYEAGPCKFVIYHGLHARGHECWVVARSNTPRRLRDRIKTDRRDSLKPARLAALLLRNDIRDAGKTAWAEAAP